MNHSQLNKEIIDRLQSSKTYSLMKEFQEKVSLFPAHQFEVKKKREKIVFEASEKVYNLTTIFKSLVHEFSNSIVLICNETCVQYMIEETVRFIVQMEEFYKEKDKIVKGIQELNEYYKQFNLKAKHLTDALFYDLEMYSTKYNFCLDKKEVANRVKECMIMVKQSC